MYSTNREGMTPLFIYIGVGSMKPTSNPLGSSSSWGFIRCCMTVRCGAGCGRTTSSRDSTQKKHILLSVAGPSDSKSASKSEFLPEILPEYKASVPGLVWTPYGIFPFFCRQKVMPRTPLRPFSAVGTRGHFLSPWVVVAIQIVAIPHKKA